MKSHHMCTHPINCGGYLIEGLKEAFDAGRNEKKTLKCKPSALIFGRGRAKKSIALQGSYNTCHVTR